jgi:hypothetical protein
MRHYILLTSEGETAFAAASEEAARKLTRTAADETGAARLLNERREVIVGYRREA